MTIEILDTHQHLIYPDRFHYPWTNAHSALAGRAFTYDDYLRASADAGITRTLFMEADNEDWQGEARFVQTLVDDPDTKVAGIIANCRPETDAGFDAWLDQVAAWDVVGLRRITHVMPDDLSTSDVFRANIKKLAGRGLTFDACFFGHQLPIAAELFRAAGDVQFVLDHCGNPDIASGDIEGWRRDLRTIAALPNVACKISGIIVNARPGEGTLDALRPVVEHCIACFGWDRVVWGSDWPVCTINGTLGDWVGICRQIVAAEAAANQAKLFHGNATRIYGVEI